MPVKTYNVYAQTSTDQTVFGGACIQVKARGNKHAIELAAAMRTHGAIPIAAWKPVRAPKKKNKSQSLDFTVGNMVPPRWVYESRYKYNKLAKQIRRGYRDLLRYAALVAAKIEDGTMELYTVEEFVERLKAKRAQGSHVV